MKHLGFLIFNEVTQMKIDKGDIVKVQNKEARLGANKFYFATILTESGRGFPVMWTKKELDTGKARAKKNPEDCPKRRSAWDKFRGRR